MARQNRKPGKSKVRALANQTRKTMAPSNTMTSSVMPGQRLCWAKVRTMQVFWPACVYASYSEAVRHTHDMAALRNIKPVLDAEDRVVYFFGVGPCGVHVRSLGPAPNLQLCIAHEEELTQEPWTGEQDFERICRQYHAVEDNISRTLKNNCFVRACEEASKYHNTVNDDDEVSCTVKRRPLNPFNGDLIWLGIASVRLTACMCQEAEPLVGKCEQVCGA